jgi:hypothetical protein
VSVPVLWGSIVRERLEVDGAFVIEVEAERDTTLVTFEGVDNADTLGRHLGSEELVGGYAEEFDVATASGGLYVVNLSSECD